MCMRTKIDGHVASLGNFPRLDGEMRMGCHEDCIVLAAHIQGEMNLARYLRDGMLAGPGEELADRSYKIRAGRLLRQPIAFNLLNECGGGHDGVAPRNPRHGAGMAIGATDAAISVADVSANTGDDSDRNPGINEYRTLLDVRLDIGMNFRGYERGFALGDSLGLEPFLRHMRGERTP